MKKHQAYVGIFLAFFLLAGMILRPIDIPSTLEECLTAEGELVKIYESGVKDIVFKLDGDDTRYYINRGLERNLSIEDLENQLLHNNIVIKYPKHWTPLDPKGSTKHLSAVILDDDIIFSEIGEG